MTTAVDRIVIAFETLTPESVAALDALYAPNARFKDPFNEVQGLESIQRIFREMFEHLEQPRFVITARIEQGAQCFLTWDFHFAFKSYQRGQGQCVHGGSHLVLDAEGRIAMHRDYWDAAEELYEKLPLMGAVLRWLKRRMGQTALH